MRRLVLVRRREVWIPTFWGWLLILLVGSGTLVFAGRHLHAFLAPNHPSGARLLVVEGWMFRDELGPAVEGFRGGRYQRIITAGGPIEAGFERLGHASYADWTRDNLVQIGLPSDSVIAVSAPASAQDRTYLSAVMVREWLEKSGLAADAIDVLSSGVHSRRTWLLYRMAFGPRARIGILAARPIAYDSDAWWTTSAGAKTVISESISWIWTEIFFQPSAPGSHEEKWGNPRVAPRTATDAPPDSAPDAGAKVR